MNQNKVYIKITGSVWLKGQDYYPKIGEILYLEEERAGMIMKMGLGEKSTKREFDEQALPSEPPEPLSEIVKTQKSEKSKNEPKNEPVEIKTEPSKQEKK